MSTPLCPVCGQKLTNTVCPHCGYDESRDYMRYPSLGLIPDEFRSVGVNRPFFEDVTAADAGLPLLYDRLLAVRDMLPAAEMNGLEREAKQCGEQIGALIRTIEARFQRGGTAPAPDFAYELRPEGVTIISYLGDKEEVVIPEIIEGRRVVRISSWAFDGRASLRSVVVPEGVTLIGNNAFSNCRNLVSVKLPNSLTEIGEQAFYGCCKLALLIVPDGVRRIPNRCFCGCTSLSLVVLPHSVSELGMLAFSGCSNLKALAIPGSVTGIGRSCFAGCRALTDAVIPARVTHITVSCFADCVNLNTVTLSEGVEEIGEKAFSGCKAIRILSLPLSLKFVRYKAFDSGSITEVRYAGSQQQWSLVRVDSSFGGNTALKRATVDYNENGSTD